MQALTPYVTLLPARTPVNLNTASPEVIYAAVNGINQAEAAELVARRALSPFRGIADASAAMPNHAGALTEGTVGVSSRFFEVRGRLRMDRLIVEERSLVQRDGLDVRTLRRDRGVLDRSSVAMAPLSR